MWFRPDPVSFVRSAYLEQVRDTAPDELIGRDGELAEWAEFCAGPEAYAWWQAGPWAGKSALASWFVTHPPAGADVVSFFITGRLAGQADSDAFLDTMTEQLHALGPGGENPSAVVGARVGAWLSLLASAAAQAGERGRRLVVVADGLDEDKAGAAPLRERPSIASLLPRRPPPGVRVIVTSRPDPGLPDDVQDGHPLRTCTPRRLPVSQVAQDLARRAQQELRDLLTGDQAGIDVAGYDRRLRRRPDQKRPVSADRSPAAEARPHLARGIRPQPGNPRTGRLPGRQHRSRVAGLPVRARDPADHRRRTTR